MAEKGLNETPYISRNPSLSAGIGHARLRAENLVKKLARIKVSCVICWQPFVRVCRLLMRRSQTLT